jgi:hypothetical protein
MTHAQVLDGEDDLQIQKVPAKIMNISHEEEARGKPPDWGLGQILARINMIRKDDWDLD